MFTNAKSSGNNMFSTRHLPTIVLIIGIAAVHFNSNKFDSFVVLDSNSSIT